jgi:hypothetical protein
MNAVDLGRVTVQQLERQHFLPGRQPTSIRLQNTTVQRTTPSDQLMSNIIPESHIFSEIDKNGLARPQVAQELRGSFTTTARNNGIIFRQVQRQSNPANSMSTKLLPTAESQPKNFYASFDPYQRGRMRKPAKNPTPLLRSRKACHKRRRCESPQRRNTPRPKQMEDASKKIENS